MDPQKTSDTGNSSTVGINEKSMPSYMGNTESSKSKRSDSAKKTKSSKSKRSDSAKKTNNPIEVQTGVSNGVSGKGQESWSTSTSESSSQLDFNQNPDGSVVDTDQLQISSSPNTDLTSDSMKSKNNDGVFASSETLEDKQNQTIAQEETGLKVGVERLNTANTPASDTQKSGAAKKEVTEIKTDATAPKKWYKDSKNLIPSGLVTASAISGGTTLVAHLKPMIPRIGGNPIVIGVLTGLSAVLLALAVSVVIYNSVGKKEVQQNDEQKDNTSTPNGKLADITTNNPEVALR